MGGFNELSASCSNLSLQGVIEVEDTATLCLYGEEKQATFIATNANKFDQPIEITLCLDNGDRLEIVGDNLKINGQAKDFETNTYYGKACYGMGHAPLIADFYDCIKSGKKFAIDGKEGAKALRIVLAAYRSNGQRVKI